MRDEAVLRRLELLGGRHFVSQVTRSVCRSTRGPLRTVKFWEVHDTASEFPSSIASGTSANPAPYAVTMTSVSPGLLSSTLRQVSRVVEFRRLPAHRRTSAMDTPVVTWA